VHHPPLRVVGAFSPRGTTADLTTWLLKELSATSIKFIIHYSIARH
jgi:hypothetical protein